MGVWDTLERLESEPCGDVVAQVTPIEKFESMEYLVSAELAASIEACDTAEAWMQALRANPLVVGESSVSESDALVYLASSCGLLPDGGASLAPCRDSALDGITLE